MRVNEVVLHRYFLTDVGSRKCRCLSYTNRGAQRSPGKVEEWRHGPVGPTYPLLPVSEESASLAEP